MALNNTLGIQMNRLRFRFYTQNRWISGCLSTAHRRLLDFLNTEHRQPVLAEEVEAQSLRTPQGSGDRLDTAYISIPSVLFAVPVEEAKDSPAQSADTVVWVKKRPERARFAAGPYEIVGDIYLVENAKLEASLFAGRNRFFAVGKAVIRRLDDPAFEEEQEIVFVNWERLDYFAAAPSSS